MINSTDIPRDLNIPGHLWKNLKTGEEVKYITVAHDSSSALLVVYAKPDNCGGHETPAFLMPMTQFLADFEYAGVDYGNPAYDKV
jgi:hypothetical protein